MPAAAKSRMIFGYLTDGLKSVAFRQDLIRVSLGNPAGYKYSVKKPRNLASGPPVPVFKP